ncbi:hypothetical protein V7128_07440 [Neobacillus vireti]|uniref:DNA ligase LigA-related protein n=1 Tax=Neobacillus vireti TaxID=220686 RepID=UPI002FFDAC8D
MRKDVIELMNRRERQLTVHSFLYYQLNESIISDHTFDLWSKELVDLMEQYPEEFKQTVFYNDFKDFDGSSGFDLPYGNPNIQSIGYRLLEYHRKLRG